MQCNTIEVDELIKNKYPIKKAKRGYGIYARCTSNNRHYVYTYSLKKL